MKTLNAYGDKIKSDWNHTMTLDLVKECNLIKKLKEKYPLTWRIGGLGNENTIIADEFHINSQLTTILSLIGKEFRNKTILDLGCGSNGDSFDNKISLKTRSFEPWLCRALYELNIKCMGIDCGDLDNEKFEHCGYFNLLGPDSLGFLQDSSVDVAHARLLYSSPQLEKLNRGNSKSLHEYLLPQLERIVKPEGFFVYTPNT